MSYTLRKVNTPTSIIKLTSKISFALAFDGSDSASNIQGNSLTYAWSVAPAAGVTIAAPAAVTTTINVPSGPGEFVVTLTVTDSTTLLTDSTTYTVKTDRVIDINGTNEDNNSLITSLQTAFNWITANDAGNATNYLINVYGTTTDAVRIVPVAGVKVVFQANGKLPVGVDFGAGAFQWGGTTKNQSQTHITGAGIDLITLVAGANVQLEGITLFHAVNNGNLINSVGILTCDNCIIFQNGTNSSAITQTGGSCNLYKNLISSPGFPLAISGAVCLIAHNQIFHQQSATTTIGTAAVNLTNVSGMFGNNFIRSVSPNVAQNCFGIIITGSFTSSFHCTNNHVRIQKTGAAVNIAAALLISGTNVVAPIISNNVFDGNVTYGMMAFNTNNTSFLCTNNYFQGSIAAAFSTNTLVAPPVALAFANAPMFNNVFNTIVTGFVMAPGTAVLPGENIRV